MRIAVIGAGASGLCAAIQAKKTNSFNNVMLIEKNQRVGKKILVTGNGKCNLTNLQAKPECYFPSGDFTAPAFEKFGVENTLEFFEGLGLYTYADEAGRVYPLSNQASTVLDVLRFECKRLGVETMCDYKVKTVEKTRNGFMINGTFFFDRVIVACGGKSNPVHGSDGYGYELLSSLGHSFKNIRPALVPLICRDFPKNLKGVRSVCEAVLYENGEKKVGCTGEVQFTDNGLSGIPVMNLSGFADIESGKRYSVALDLVPSLSETEVKDFILERISRDENTLSENLLSGIINKQLGLAMLKICDIPQNAFIGSVGKNSVEKLAKLLKHWEVEVKYTKGYDFSQVTAGGVNTDEFCPETLASRLCDGLYACGEIFDIFAECGGFNLQWAWASGRLAGLSASEENDDKG